MGGHNPLPSPAAGAFAGGGLPSAGTLKLARELAYVAAFELVLEPVATMPLHELRELDHSAFTPLRAAPYLALEALRMACPEVATARLATCLGLDLGTAEGLAETWSRVADWFAPMAAEVAGRLGRGA